MGLSWPTIRGQPRQLPFDGTPLVGAQADVPARIGWLLRINRLGSAFGSMTATKWTVELGLEVSRHTEISKLERGSKGPSAIVLNRYERALGYDPGTFRGVVDGVRRRLDPKARSSRTRQLHSWSIDELDDAIAAGIATGEQWLHLADFLISTEPTALPRRIVGEWMSVLARELTMSRGLHVAPRLEALCVLAASSKRALQLEEAIWRLVDQAPEHARRLISILGSSTRPGVVPDLVSLMTDERTEHLYGAAAALSDQLACGHVRPGHLDGLRDVAGMKGSLNGALARGLLVSAGAHDHSDERAHRLTVARMQRAPGLQRYVRAIQQTGAPEDPMVKRLLQESLVPILPGRALPAQMLIAASPYRDSIIEEATAISHDATASHEERQAVGNLNWIGETPVDASGSGQGRQLAV